MNPARPSSLPWSVKPLMSEGCPQSPGGSDLGQAFFISFPDHTQLLSSPECRLIALQYKNALLCFSEGVAPVLTSGELLPAVPFPGSLAN